MAERQWSDRQLSILNAGNENLLVSAAAGAGKTSVLVEKIYRIITDEKTPTDVDRLLVMTFTNAAAAEMKERLARRLTDELERNPDNRRLQRQQMLIHNAQICTIDSFCVSVVREFFNAVDIDPTFRIGSAPEFRLLEADVMKELLEDRYAAGEEDFIELITGFTNSKSDSGIEDIITRLASCARAHANPEKWLRDLQSELSATSPEELDATDYMQFLEAYVNDSVDVAIEQAGKGLKLALIEERQENYVGMFRQDLVYLNEIREASGYSGKYNAIIEGFSRAPSKAGKDPDEAIADQCKEIRKQYKTSIDNLKGKFYTMNPETVVLSGMIADRTSVTCIDLTIEYLERLGEQKQNRNIIDFNDLEHLALEVLTDTDGKTGELTASPQAILLRERYDWIFVDEYQDSNAIQEELVAAIAGEAGRYPYTFMVGDVKQSIYKFRMAKPELFMNRYENYTQDPSQGRVIVLDNNYRSGVNILDSTNDVFSRVMRREIGGIDYDDDASLKPGTEEQKAATTPPAQVLIVDGSDDDEAAAAARAVWSLVNDDAHTGVKREFKDIVVLTRTKSIIRKYREVFESYGISAISSDSSGFLDTFEIRTVLDYLRILDNPLSDIPFVGVLASVMGGMTNEELALLRVETDRSLSFYEAARDYVANGHDSSIRTKLTAFFETFDEIRSMNLCRDLDKVIEQIYERTGFYSFCRTLKGGEARISNLDMLESYAAEYEKSSYTGLFSFVRYVEELKKTLQDLDEAVSVEAADAVSIMTFHASKGLEFPVVIIGGMGHTIKNQDGDKSVITSTDYGIVPPAVDTSKMVRMKTVKHEVISRRLMLDLIGEELRLFYVAMTRAREQLILIGRSSSDKKGDTAGKWESEATVLRSTQRHSYMYVSGIRSYFDMVMPTAMLCPDHFTIMRLEAQDEEETAQKQTAQKQPFTADAYETLSCEEPDSEVLRELEYTYPYEGLMKVPSKLSVSDIKKKHMMDEFEDAQEKPAFLTHAASRKDAPEGGITGAAYGTLMHKVMQFLPFDLEPDRTEEFLDGLVGREIITATEREALNPVKFKTFLKSELAAVLKAADSRGQLRREQPFILGMKACDIDREQYGDSEILIPVQGVIDCLFEDKGDIYILDYKTDRVKDADELARMYRAQLQTYARAAEDILGKKTGGMILYSFSLAETINL